MYPSIKDVLQYFEYAHPPEALQAVSKPIGELAHQMAALAPDSPQTTLGLHHLLAAKDCFVRANLPKKPAT